MRWWSSDDLDKYERSLGERGPEYPRKCWGERYCESPGPQYHYRHDRRCAYYHIGYAPGQLTGHVQQIREILDA